MKIDSMRNTGEKLMRTLCSVHVLSHYQDCLASELKKAKIDPVNLGRAFGIDVLQPTINQGDTDSSSEAVSSVVNELLKLFSEQKTSFEKFQEVLCQYPQLKNLTTKMSTKFKHLWSNPNHIHRWPDSGDDEPDFCEPQLPLLLLSNEKSQDDNLISNSGSGVLSYSKYLKKLYLEDWHRKEVKWPQSILLKEYIKLFLIILYISYFVLMTSECLILEDCRAWYELGIRNSGVFSINPDYGEPFQVYCDMETDGGGWTVFQRRVDGSVDFYRGWSDYEQGFGSFTGEFWLGLSKIHRLSKPGNKTLRIDLGDFSNQFAYAKYSYFSVGDSTKDYTLSLSGYSGNAGDTMLSHQESTNGRRFTTKDRDNDLHPSGNCAVSHSGAWWYHSCHGANLNGLYLRGNHSSYANGVEWTTWTGYHYSLRFTEMKLA